MTVVNFYSTKKGEIERFLSAYYQKTLQLENDLKWEQEYENPIEMAEIIGTFIDNNDAYAINMWVSFDPGLFINVTDNNVDNIIRYLYERFPY